MTEEEYLNERVKGQIEWYSKESQRNQFWFKSIRFVEIVAAAVIPFLSGLGDGVTLYQYLIGFLGMAVAVAAATTALFKYQENWIEYRTTAEQLKHEKYLFLTSARPYDTADNFLLFVERVEALISKENSAWANMTRKPVPKKE